MPLSWVMSSFMILIIIVSMGMIYSEKGYIDSVFVKCSSGVKVNSWCW